MAQVVVTLKIMPESPETDLGTIELNAKAAITEFCSAGEFKTKVEPVAFGLNALLLYFAMDESVGGTEKLEKKISGISGVNSVEVTDVRRAIG